MALQGRTREAIALRRGADPAADDRFRGLYISDEQAAALLDDQDPLAAGFLPDLEAERAADAAERAGGVVRLRQVAGAFGLDPVDVELLLIAAAPDLDARFERAYGYLHDDVTRRRASIGLALELCGASLLSGVERERFGPEGPLVRYGLRAGGGPSTGRS